MIPGLLGLIGGTSAGLAMAPALRVLNWPFLVLTVVMLARGWYLNLSHGGGWQSSWARRSRLVLVVSSVIAISLLGLRFAGLLGMPLI